MITCYVRYEVKLGKLPTSKLTVPCGLTWYPGSEASIMVIFCHPKVRVTSPWRCLAFRALRPTNSTARTLLSIRRFRKLSPSQKRRAASPVMNGRFSDHYFRQHFEPVVEF